MQRLSTGVLLALLIAIPCGHGKANAEPISTDSNVRKRTFDGKSVQSERDEQEALFNYYFRNQNLKYETTLANLKKEASVPSWRVPYSAAIHPESSGGLGNVGGRAGLFGRRGAGGSSALSKYDSAFNGGQNLANSFEVRRIMGTDRALFPRMRMRRNSEHWEGYCSGFTAATIRHPEPVRPVDASKAGGAAGVVFQPSEIKALLTGIYNRTTDDSYLYLAPPSATDGGPNMGTFHLTLANYVSRAGCPVGFDRTKGQTAWNNPIYSYKVTSISDAGHRDDVHYKDVVTTVTYSYYGSDSQRQTDQDTGARVDNSKQSMTLRYTLALDKGGKIVGGRAHNAAGHFLWMPLYAVQAKKDGSVPGNPHMDVKKVLALAKASALAEVQKKYDEVVIGPAVDPSLEEESEEESEEDDQ